MNDQQFDFNDSSSKEEELDLKKWLFRMLNIWPLFVISILLCVAGAVLYVLYTQPTYEASAAILVKDEKKGAEMMDNSMLKEIGLGGNNKLVENEVEVLKSPDLLEAITNKLKLYIDINRISKIRNTSVFENEIPFIIELINPQDIKSEEYAKENDLKKPEWKIGIYKKAFLFKNESDKDYRSLQYGKVYNSNEIYFRCYPNPSFSLDHEHDSISKFYNLKISSIEDVIKKYGKLITIEQATKLATVINLGITDKNENRATAVLQSLIDKYNQLGIEDKNRVTDSTINFLNERLIAVVKELVTVEGSVEKFKSKNKITDISVDEQQYMTLAQQVIAQKAQSETQLNILNMMEQDLEKNQDNPQLVPSTLGIEEPSLGILISQHNQLVLQRERILDKSGLKNPLLLDIQEQIKEIRSKMLVNLRNLKQAYKVTLHDISQKDEELSTRIENVPVLEKKLISITRNKIVQEQIYAFLLQKREESAVTRASNIEDSRTIAQPRSLGKKWPKRIIVYSAGLLLGLLIPMGIMSAKDFLNNKVGDASQVNDNIDLPLLGVLSHIKKIKFPIIGPRSRTVAAEQIRHIRTAISFTGIGKETKTILTTSFQPGDGKSIVSLNLAASYALLDKKTVILEFDLRKPSITKYLELEKKEGISSILSGKLSVDKLLTEINGFDGNLFLIQAGHLPPNPAELISGSRMIGFMNDLKDHFDYIIIDTPPFSLVADATLLQKYADISLVVLRQDHTSREAYAELKKHVIRHPDHPLYLVLNDVGKRKRYQGGYGSYSYGSGYYLDEE